MFRRNITRQQVVDYAKKKISESPYYLDTETTGLEKTDEIIEIAIVDSQGRVIFESFFRPTIHIPQAAINIHHISNEMDQILLG